MTRAEFERMWGAAPAFDDTEHFRMLDELGERIAKPDGKGGVKVSPAKVGGLVAQEICHLVNDRRAADIGQAVEGLLSFFED